MGFHFDTSAIGCNLICVVDKKKFVKLNLKLQHVLIYYYRHHTNKLLQNKCYEMGSVQEIATAIDLSTKPKVEDEFLLAMIKSPNKKKILVHFRLKNNDVEHLTWLTHRQYLVFRTIDCIDYCRITP
jgi:hypothetical protein